MTHDMIPDIAQMKLAELTTLGEAVERLQGNVAARRASIESVAARNARLQDGLSDADGRRQRTQGDLSRAQAAAQAARGLFTACDAALSRARAAEEGFDKIASAQVELVRHLAAAAGLLSKVNQLANRRKAANPHLPDALIEQLGRAAADCPNVLALALAAQDAGLTARAGIAATVDALDRSQRGASDLLLRLADDDGAVSILRDAARNAENHYMAASGIAAGSSAQMEHAAAALSAEEARLASLQAALAAMTKAPDKKS